ncbi:MAG TPA: galactokinase [Gemmatimonadaceae bacterium]|nr:galactokinase [Gemmatimonadaceae bacterium]
MSEGPRAPLSRRDAADTAPARFVEFAPDVVASAPGRVNLIGEHTDYNGGEVLPMAIALRTWVAVRRRMHGNVLHVRSASHATEGEVDLRAPRCAGAWWDYLAGVVAQLAAGGLVLPPCDVAITSDIPAGAGLSSSAALEVATALALAELTGASLPMREIALLGHRAETAFVGVAVGIMDQFASALGAADRALHIDCDQQVTELIPMRDAVLVIDTRGRRALRRSAFNARRAECDRALALLRRAHPELRHLAGATVDEIRDAQLPAPLDRRAMHVVEETDRVRAAVSVLRRGEPLPGELLCASHASLRMQYECSTPELDWLVARAMQCDDVRGARLTGAGWGGCAIVVGEAAALPGAAAALATEFAATFGRSPRTWITRAEAGARLEPLGS